MVKEIIHILKTYTISFQYLKKRFYKYFFITLLLLLVWYLIINFNLLIF